MSSVIRWTVVAATVAIYGAGVPALAHAQSTAATTGGSGALGSALDSAKAALIRQLLARTQAADQAIAMMEASLPSQRQSNPRIPAVFWDRFMAEARARRGELVDMIGLVYDRHFTSEELQQLLDFYDTPIGRKLLAAQPAIAQESVEAGQQWGQRIGSAIGAQLAAEGVVVSP
jgi:hypothetical protein